MIELEKTNEILNPSIHIGLYFSWFHTPYFLINTRSVQMMNLHTCDFFRAFWVPPHGQMCSRWAYARAPLPLCLQETICGIGVVLWARRHGISLLSAGGALCSVRPPGSFTASTCSLWRGLLHLFAELQSSSWDAELKSLKLPFKNFTLEGLWTVCVPYKIFTVVIPWYSTF